MNKSAFQIFFAIKIYSKPNKSMDKMLISLIKTSNINKIRNIKKKQLFLSLDPIEREKIRTIIREQVRLRKTKT